MKVSSQELALLIDYSYYMYNINALELKCYRIILAIIFRQKCISNEEEVVRSQELNPIGIIGLWHA